MFLWRRCITQFRTGACGITGLDYVAVQLVADIYGEELSPALMDKLRVLERWQLDKQSGARAAAEKR